MSQYCVDLDTKLSAPSTLSVNLVESYMLWQFYCRIYETASRSASLGSWRYLPDDKLDTMS